MKSFRRIISLLLVLSIIVSFGAVMAFADAEADDEVLSEAAEQSQTETEPEEGGLPAETPAETDLPETDTPAQTEEPAQTPVPTDSVLTDETDESAAEETPAQADESSEEPAPEEETESEHLAEWVVPGNADVEILGGGTMLTDGGQFFYFDGGLWLDENGKTTFLTTDDGSNLNLVDGWLYYTIDSGDVRRIPASGGSVDTVYSFGAYIKQLYVMGDELRFISGGSAYSYWMSDETLETLESPSNVIGLIPTPYGNLYLTGGVFDYTLWAGTASLQSGIESCYSDEDWLVVVNSSGTWQVSLEELFSGSCTLQTYSLHQSELAVAQTGLSEEEQLTNEALFLQSDAYEAMLDGLSYYADGAYTATNSNIATVASLSTMQNNIVLRARQMAEVKWTPLKNRYSWGGDDSSYVSSHSSYGSKVVATDGTVTYGYFEAGKTYQGIPYAQAVYTGYVGWDLSISDFVGAVNSSSSRFYSGYSTYSRTAPYYGSDCSGFVSWAWDLAFRCTCSSLVNYSSYIGTSLNSLKVGDCLNCTSSHVVLVTNIGYDSSGNIVSVEITEQTPCKMRVTCYGELLPGKTYNYTGTLSYLKSYYLNGGYIIYRRSATGSVSFTEDPAVNLDESGYASAPKISVSVNSAGTAKVVTLTHEKSNAVIYYTTDGTKATTSSTKYNGAFEVTKDTTIRAIADCGSGYTGSYELNYSVSAEKAGTPFLAILDGYASDGYVSSNAKIIFVNEVGDTVYYTTDGTTPTSKSTVMPSSGITVTKNMTIKAIAVSSSSLNSDVVTQEIEVGKFHVITANSASGGYISPTGATGVLDGADYTFTLVPDDRYELVDVVVDGVSVGTPASYTFKNVTAGHTISATFSVDLPFTDVTNQWYAQSVAFTYSKGLFSGVSSTKFSPNGYMTRGMFITVLGRYANAGTDLESWSGTLGITNGSYIYVRVSTTTAETSRILATTKLPGEHIPVLSKTKSGLDGAVWYKVKYNGTEGFIRATTTDSSAKTLLYVYEGGFTDLPDGAYYTGYAQWANIYGIIQGQTTTSFGSSGYISRQDICVLLYRYLTQYMSYKLSSTTTVFSDDGSIADYAKTAVYAMKNIGIVNGYSDGSFKPNNCATRAEVATMFANLYDWMNG